MTDQIMLDIAGAVAQGALASVGESAKEAVTALVKAVRAKLGSRALETPELAAAIEQAAADDPGFAAELHRLWNQVQTVATDGGVVMNFTGRAEKSVQIHTVHGGATFN